MKSDMDPVLDKNLFHFDGGMSQSTNVHLQQMNSNHVREVNIVSN